MRRVPIAGGAGIDPQRSATAGSGASSIKAAPEGRAPMVGEAAANRHHFSMCGRVAVAPKIASATMGIDIGKNSFHVIGLDRRGAIVLQQKWRGTGRQHAASCWSRSRTGTATGC
jgi:hypothetical protein